jgi:hypothetical protein
MKVEGLPSRQPDQLMKMADGRLIRDEMQLS